MIKKQKLAVIIGILVFIALICVYIFVLSPMLQKTEPDETPELLEGEVLGTDNRVQMMEHIEKARIKSIEVHNASGGFTFYRGSDNEFYIKGKEGVPYDMTVFAQLVVNAGYTLSMERYTDVEDMSVYGLGEDDEPAYYIITTTSGKSHKIYVGDQLVTGGGYYCSYDGRDGVVYILDSSFSYTLLADVNSLISPMVVNPISSSDYYTTDDFYIVRNGELVVWIDYMTPEEINDSASIGNYRMLSPAEYSVNTTNFVSVLEMLSSFIGESTVEAGSLENSMDQAYLKETYNIDIDNPAYSLGYFYNDIQCDVIFSPPADDGTVYAYSTLFNTVCTVDMSKLPFMEWELIKFVDTGVFYKNINNIAQMKFDTPDSSVTFKINGEDKNISITDSVNNTPYSEEQITNFRQFYKVVLSMKMIDYTESTDKNEDKCILTMTVKTDAGEETVYKFYAYSTRRCYYTIDGNGEFYTMRDSVEKVISDMALLLSGQPVDAYANS